MITAVLTGEMKVRLFFASAGFREGLNVTGYILYPDTSKSESLSFVGHGDGIYSTEVDVRHFSSNSSDRFGVVIKEDGTTKAFETLLVVY